MDNQPLGIPNGIVCREVNWQYVYIYSDFIESGIENALNNSNLLSIILLMEKFYLEIHNTISLLATE